MVRSQHHRRPGLTLLELLLVVAIIIMIGAVAYPTLDSMYGDVRVKAAADQVRASCTEARTRAIEDARPYRLSVSPGTGKFKVAPDSGEFWDGSDSGGGMEDESTAAPYIEESELTKPIVFELANAAAGEGEWTTVVIFNPDGTCSADIDITLQDDDDSTPVIVHIRAMTGAVTVRKRTAEER